MEGMDCVSFVFDRLQRYPLNQIVFAMRSLASTAG